MTYRQWKAGPQSFWSMFPRDVLADHLVLGEGRDELVVSVGHELGPEVGGDGPPSVSTAFTGMPCLVVAEQVVAVLAGVDTGHWSEHEYGEGQRGHDVHGRHLVHASSLPTEALQAHELARATLARQ